MTLAVASAHPCGLHLKAQALGYEVHGSASNRLIISRDVT